MNPEPTTWILVVDDEVAHMRALCETLHDQGYETTGCTSAEEALQRLEEASYDLLLTDLMLPGMDGITLLKAALKTSPDLMGIIMTGEGTIATAVEAMKTGAFDYILKPFKLKIILPVLARALAVKRLKMENSRLEKGIRERTRELEAANKELEAFTYSVSHDLRAPLRSIGGFSSLLIKHYSAQLNSEVCTMLSQIVSQTHRMEQLIEALLRFSRMNRQRLCKQPVRMQALVTEVLEDLQKENPKRRVEIIRGEFPDTLGDPALLKQVLFNLLSNAFKFTSQQPNPVIEIGCQWEADQPVYFIRDNGAGFDMRYADQLFGVFKRLHLVEEFEGTGVGLSIVHRIIQRHGGQIRAEAEVDRGAVFYFSLPGENLD